MPTSNAGWDICSAVVDLSVEVCSVGEVVACEVELEAPVAYLVNSV